MTIYTKERLTELLDAKLTPRGRGVWHDFGASGESFTGDYKITELEDGFALSQKMRVRGVSHWEKCNGSDVWELLEANHG